MRFDSMIGTDKIRNDMTVKLCIFIHYSEFFPMFVDYIAHS